MIGNKHSALIEEGDVNDEEDQFVKGIESELEAGCVYVDRLDFEEKPDEELMELSKGEIINFKNYQIIKCKEYITSLEKEKEDLINDFKQTTEALLNRIKELEYNQIGVRPETAKIAKSFKKSNGNDTSSFNQPLKQRCPNCSGEFLQSEFIEHSLQCLRKKFKCTKCGELMSIEAKELHFNSFKAIDKMTEAINANNAKLFSKCLSHGFPINPSLNEQSNESLIHFITRANRPELLALLLSTASYEVDIDKENKSKESALIIAIDLHYEECARVLIKNKADVKKRNKGDMSPLMLSCKHGLSGLVKILIARGANVNEKNILGETPLKIAQINKHEQLALMLIDEYRAEITFK